MFALTPCQSKLHTPKPLYANVIPTAPDIIVETILILACDLKFIAFVSFIPCTIVNEPINKQILMITMIFDSIGVLKKSAMNGAAMERIIQHNRPTAALK